MPTSLTRRFTSGLSAVALVATSFLLAPAAHSDTAQPAAQPAAPATVVSGSMDWGVKESFTGYVSMPFAGGGWEVDGVTHSGSTFLWPAVAGGEINPDAVGDIAFEGAVRFHAHDEVLDVSFSDPIISFSGASPVLIVEAEGRLFVDTTTKGELVDYGRVELAALSEPVITAADDTITVAFETATLSESGVEAFGGFYDAGVELDSLTITLETETPEAPSQPACGPDSAPADLSATPGYMGWGLKSSFIGYLLSPRGGGTLNGCDGAWGTDILNYTLASGTQFDPENPGTLNFEGNLNLYAHGGGMDLGFSNPTITFTDSDTAVMSLGASGTVGGAGGQWVDSPVRYDDFARLGNVEITRNDNGSVTIASNTVTSGAGTEAVLGAYPAGTELDPMSITLNAISVAPEAGAVCGPDSAPADLDALSGYFGWGMKESFIGYLVSPAGGGTLGGCDGAWGTNILNYTLADGTQLDPENPGTLSFEGTINLNAHGGVLNIDFADPVISFSDTSNAVLSFTASGSLRGAEGGWADNPSTVADYARLADIQFAENSDGSVTITSDSVTAGEGTSYVLGAYPAGTELDPISITVNSSAIGTEPGPVEPGPTDPVDPVDPVEPVVPKPVDPVVPNPPAVIGEGALDWRVKESFLTYLKSPVAQGGWTTSDGVTGTFRFPLSAGQTIDAKNLSTVKFDGKVDFRGHDDALRIVISKPTIEKSGSSWRLTANMASRNIDSTEAPGVIPAPQRVVIADLSAPKTSTANGITSMKFETVKLTATGSRAFADFYEPGELLAPITVSLADAEASLPPAAPAPGGSNGSTGGTTPPIVAPSPAPSETPANAIVDRSAEVDPTKTRVTSGSLQWGVRQSFTTYIRSAVANGGWTTSGGVSWNGSTFVFPARGGLYDTAARTGELHYGGTINFSGHDDLMKLTMTNPSIVINGNSAALYLTVQSSNMDGVMTNHGRVHFANVTLSNVQSSNSSLSFTTSSVVLTPAGAAAFAGFYEPGVQLSPLTASASLTPATVYDAETGELKTYNAFGGLAYTGASSTGLALGAVVLILMGMTAMRLRRVTAHS